MYKFNTQESDLNGELNTRYLNTCSVTVEPQTNAVGLPYINLNEPFQIKYPVANPTIPSLDLTSNTSEWKNLFSDGMQSELASPQALEGDFHVLEIFRNTKNIFDLFTQNAVTLHETTKSSCSGYNYVFDSDVMSTINQKNDIFLSAVFNLNANIEIYLTKGSHYYSDSNNYIKIHNRDSLTLEICSMPESDCESLFNFKYDSNESFTFNFYINLKGAIKIYNAVDRKVYSTRLVHPFYDYIMFQSDSCGNEVHFKLVELSKHALSADSNIISPWLPIQNGSSFFLSYYRKSGHSLISYLVDAYEDKQNLKRLDLEELSIIEVNTTAVDEIVVAKVVVTFPANWTENKQIQIKSDNDVYIKDIWEGGDSEIYRIQSSQPCDKSHIKDIYNIAVRDSIQGTKVSFCSNGGFLDSVNATCICPPGFTGDFCEIACGRNSYGKKCSKSCSLTDSACKGMLLCTPSYGCTCPTGYHGDQCLEQCEEGTYGANCAQLCGPCQGGCDKYTGHCRGKCDSPHMIWPSCKHPHSYWKGSPQIVGSTFNTIKLSLDFNSDNIFKSYDRIKFFIVQYREDTETTWTNNSYEIFTQEGIQYSVHNLKAGRKYLFRVALVDETLRTSDPKLSKISEGLTECSVSDKKNHLSITKSTNTSIELTWNEETNIETNECPFSSYILEIDDILDDKFVETRKITEIERKWFEIKNLRPNETYLIKLKKTTVHGESRPVFSINATTDATIDYSMPIVGLTAKTITGSDIQLEWFHSPFYKTYYIKYKLLKQLSCGQTDIQSPIQVISTKSTKYTLTLEPNTQYHMFVTGDESQMTNKDNLTVITDGKLPSTSPTLVKHTFRFTNESVQVEWTDSVSSCQYMNGFFKKYFVQLMDTQGKVLKSSETYDRKLEFSELSPKTYYKLRIRYVNHIGYNPDVYLEHKFTTRATSFIIAQDLNAYKTSADMIGLRWKIPNNNSTVTGVNIKIQNRADNRSLNITNIELLQCKAWPSYLCYNMTHLKPNMKYTVSINIFSEEFPEGGSQKAIQVITREMVPSPVSDIQVEDISNKNMTISWRIPFLLNGILRKFIIDVEHLSSFDETSCCQSIVTINHLVNEEQEIYSHVIENIQMGSSYQVTVRALTKRLGQEVSKIIVIPPNTIPIKRKAHVKVDNQDIIWEEQTENQTNISSAENELITDLLVIVQSNENKSDNNLEASQFRTEMSRLLKSNNWWVAHVCKVNEECSVNIGNDKESGSLTYGEIRNKPLTVGHNYTILMAQVNKYLSARSYTIARSVPFLMKGDLPTSTTTQTPQQRTTHFHDTSPSIQNELGDYLTPDNYNLDDEMTVITEIPQDYDVPIPNLEEP